ncbi:MAG: cupin domain-containing protein [Actinomycetota bacterium]
MGKARLTEGGTVLRSDRMEVVRIRLRRGEGSGSCAHPEEETIFVEEGRLQVTLGEGESSETYVVGAGQATFHPSGVPHRVSALEDTWTVGFKNLVESSGPRQAGRLQ